MKKKMYYYFHAGSKNHGCEAIVRSTYKAIGVSPILISQRPEEDKQYGIDQLVEVKGKETYRYRMWEKAWCYIWEKYCKQEQYGYHLVSKYESLAYENGSIALSIGGDNYCYGNAYNWHLAAMNRWLHKRGVKTVLWGCSIEPSTMTKAMKKDIATYDLITAREQISYNYLKQYNNNTVLVSDSAFLLEREAVSLPTWFEAKNTIGINISPLMEQCETIPGITMENYRQLLRYIVRDTTYQIALIPHVVCNGNDDRELLEELQQEFQESNRVFLVEDENCMRLKGYISKCELFVGARTHATIAAYSTCVPTLVLGYSTKARGIAKDLFGEEEGYVLAVQQLKDPMDLVKAVKHLEEKKDDIRKHLEQVIPSYCKRVEVGVNAVQQLQKGSHLITMDENGR